jgi:predicted acetyltransferase
VTQSQPGHHLPNFSGFVPLIPSNRQPLTFSDPEVVGRRVLYLFSTPERALKAAELADLSNPEVAAFSLDQIMDRYGDLIRDKVSVVLLETPHSLGRFVPLGNPAPSDGFVQIDESTEDAFDDIQGRGFGERRHALYADWEADEEPRRFALRDQGRLASGLEAQYYDTLWGSTHVPMESLGGVVSPLETRRQGKNRELVREVLGSMRERGIPISTITTPFSYAFYRRLGWEFAFARPQFTFPPTAMLTLPKQNGQLRHYRYNPATGSAPLELALIYELALSPTFQGYARRNVRQWHERMQGNLTDTYVWDGPLGPSGYMIVQVQADHIAIKELAAIDDNALLGLARMMCSLDSQTDKVVWDALPHTPILRWVDETGLIKVQIVDQGMFRLVDVKAAFEARPVNPAMKGGTLALSVDDPLCEWNTGTWQFEFAQGQVHVSPAGSHSRAGQIDIRALGLIYANAYTARDAVRFGGATLSEPQIELLTQAYAGKEPLVLEWF